MTTEEREAWKLFAAAIVGGVCANGSVAGDDIVNIASKGADKLLEQYVQRFGCGAMRPPADLPDELPPPRTR